MKKIILTFLLVASSLVSAQSLPAEKRVSIGKGLSTIQIQVNGRSNSFYDQEMRIRWLEEAVRDLQNQVFNLNFQQQIPQTKVITTYVCSLTTNFDGTFMGKAKSQVEASAIALQNCEKARASFCSRVPIKCDKTEELVRY